MCTALEFSFVRFASGKQVAMVTNRMLRALIRGCLQQDADERPSMEDIIGELEQPI